MALHFNGTDSYIKFPNIRHTTDLEPSVLVVFHKPTALDAATHQYLFAQSDAGEATLGGVSLTIVFNTDDYRVFVGRDTVKYNTSSGSAVKWGQWNMTFVYNTGNLTDDNNPRMINIVFPYPTYPSLAYLADSNVGGSGNYIPGAGNWAIGASGYNSFSHYEGDIEYVAYYSGIGHLGEDLISLISGASPLKIQIKYLKFFVKLNDPNNIIDIISGRKAGIVGSLTPSTSSPRINY